MNVLVEHMGRACRCEHEAGNGEGKTHLHVAGIQGGQPGQEAVAVPPTRQPALLDALACDPRAQCLRTTRVAHPELGVELHGPQ